MILYLDTSALVKCYVAERDTQEVISLAGRANLLGSSLISRVELAAAIAKAVRRGLLTAEMGRGAQSAFLNQWTDLARIPVTEALVSRAGILAWDYTLRGYDAVQLASALTWQESVGRPVTLATFDRELWEAGQEAGIEVWPARLTR